MSSGGVIIPMRSPDADGMIYIGALLNLIRAAASIDGKEE
jgi:hypothetical protein